MHLKINLINHRNKVFLKRLTSSIKITISLIHHIPQLNQVTGHQCQCLIWTSLRSNTYIHSAHLEIQSMWEEIKICSSLHSDRLCRRILHFIGIKCNHLMLNMDWLIHLIHLLSHFTIQLRKRRITWLMIGNKVRINHLLNCSISEGKLPTSMEKLY